MRKPDAGVLLSRWKAGIVDNAAAAVAAALAFAVARMLLNHPSPIFSSVAAIICLAPGVAGRKQQAVNMMLGLVIGILVGEVALAVSPAPQAPATLFCASLVSMIVATSFRMLPIIAIQAGVSTILVLTMGPEIAGAARFLDALVGTCVALAIVACMHGLTGQRDEAAH